MESLARQSQYLQESFGSLSLDPPFVMKSTICNQKGMRREFSGREISTLSSTCRRNLSPAASTVDTAATPLACLPQHKATSSRLAQDASGRSVAVSANKLDASIKRKCVMPKAAGMVSLCSHGGRLALCPEEVRVTGICWFSVFEHSGKEGKNDSFKKL